MKIIKKEKDGKFYCSASKKYVVLKDILQLIKNQTDFKVIDQDHKDITKDVLYAVIFYNKYSVEHSLEDILGFITQGLKSNN